MSDTALTQMSAYEPVRGGDSGYPRETVFCENPPSRTLTYLARYRPGQLKIPGLPKGRAGSIPAPGTH